MSIDLKAGIVKVLDADGMATAGTGFVVYDGSFIVTCAHVICPEGCSKVPDKVAVVFLINGEKRNVSIVPEWWRPAEAEDVALLELDGPLPAGVVPLSLGSSSGTAGHSLKSFGFPDASPEEGVWGVGEILDQTAIKSVEVIQIRSTQITRGFSGAPVLDVERRRVIGMINAIIRPDRDGRNVEDAFITPIECIYAICPLLKPSEIRPYVGLAPFTEASTQFFFGRDALIGELRDHLRRIPDFLAVVGSSGSGKSSVIQAGLLPALRRKEVLGFENIHIIIVRPGSDPRNALELALQNSDLFLNGANFSWKQVLISAAHDKRVVLYIDQFEEVFALSLKPERDVFLEDLSRLIGLEEPITLMLTIRADFYDPLLASPLGDHLRSGQVNIRPMSEEELRETIIDPAKLVGLDIEEGLAEVIIEDLKETKNPLPLLQFVMNALWEHRYDGTLTFKSYRDIGGATGAIGQWATETYNKLCNEEQEIAERVFTRLVHYGEGDIPDTRQSQTIEELAGGRNEEFVHRVIKKLADARLVVSSLDEKSRQEIVEIVHDSLIIEWAKLHSWINNKRNFFVWRQRLNERLDEWNNKKQDKGALISGALLLEADGWLSKYKEELTAQETEYIEASLVSDKRERTAKMRRKLLAAIAIFIISLLAILTVTTNQYNTDLEQVNLARQLILQSEIIGSRTVDRLPLSIILAAESLNRSYSSEAEQILNRDLSLITAPIFNVVHDGHVYAVAFSPDGKYLAAASSNNTVRIWEISHNREVGVVKHNASVNDIAFSPDGSYIATASDDNTSLLCTVPTCEVIVSLNHSGPVNDVAFSPKGNYIATASADKTSALWENQAGWKRVATMSHMDSVNSIAFSPDESYLATGSDDNLSGLWVVPSGLNKRKLKHDGPVWSVEFSPDGKYLATASFDKMAHLWVIPGGQEYLRLKHNDIVNDVAFSSDGNFLATAGRDNTARAWNLSTGSEISRMNHNWRVRRLTFSPDGKYLATASFDNTARVWCPTSGGEIQRICYGDMVNTVAFSPDGRYIASGSNDRGISIRPVANEITYVAHKRGVSSISFSPVGGYFATSSDDNTAVLWENLSGRRIFTASHEAPVNDVTFSSDGRYFATVSDDDTAKLWKTPDGHNTAIMKHSGAVWKSGFSADGKKLATASDDHTARIWDVPRGRQIANFTHNDTVWDIAFSPDASKVATASSDKTAGIWDVNRGILLYSLKHDDAVNAIAFSPDGNILATASDDNTARLWEVSSGQEIARLTHEDDLWDIAFSPDGKYVATGCNDGTARIWDAANTHIVSQILHGECVYNVEFSPDSKFLVTSGRGNYAGIWVASNGTNLDLLPHAGYVYYATFSPDGKYVASAGLDGVARIWHFQEKNPISKACEKIRRNLSPEEWRLYLPPGEKPCTTCHEY